MRFQSLTRDSNHSNQVEGVLEWAKALFQSLTRDSNHSNEEKRKKDYAKGVFQSLTRDSNHSNLGQRSHACRIRCFNPSRRIAIIQTPIYGEITQKTVEVSIPHAG